MKNRNDIVALNDSQILRWICELNGIENLDFEVSKIKKEIKLENMEKLRNKTSSNPFRQTLSSGLQGISVP